MVEELLNLLSVQKGIKESTVEVCIRSSRADPSRAVKKRPKRREEERIMLQEQTEKEKNSHKDVTFHQFLLSMNNITNTLPIGQQRQIRRKLFEIVSEAVKRVKVKRHLHFHLHSHQPQNLIGSCPEDFMDWFQVEVK